MTATKSRYRPAFSEEEVEALATILLQAYLADIAKPPYDPTQLDTPANSSKAFSPEMKLIHHGLIGKINTLRTKIANKALNPAYTVRKYVEPAIAILEDLGVDESELATLDGTETKEQYWKRCYLKYVEDEYSCTVPEIEAALEHKYLNDLMSPEEEANFETNIQRKNN